MYFKKEYVADQWTITNNRGYRNSEEQVVRESLIRSGLRIRWAVLKRDNETVSVYVNKVLRVFSFRVCVNLCCCSSCKWRHLDSTCRLPGQWYPHHRHTFRSLCYHRFFFFFIVIAYYYLDHSSYVLSFQALSILPLLLIVYTLCIPSSNLYVYVDRWVCVPVYKLTFPAYIHKHRQYTHT